MLTEHVWLLIKIQIKNLNKTGFDAGRESVQLFRWIFEWKCENCETQKPDGTLRKMKSGKWKCCDWQIESHLPLFDFVRAKTHSSFFRETQINLNAVINDAPASMRIKFLIEWWQRDNSWCKFSSSLISPWNCIEIQSIINPHYLDIHH